MSAMQRNRTDIITAGVILLAVLAASVGLSLAGRTTADIATLLGTVATTVGVLLPQLSRVRRETEQQTEMLQEIHANTNGVLDKRIEDGVRRALAQQHGGTEDPVQQRPDERE